MFDDKFVSELPEDALESAIIVCDKFLGFHKSLGGSKKRQANIESYFRALAFAEVFISARKINYRLIPHIVTGKQDFEEAAIKKICDFFIDFQNECRIMQRTQKLDETFIHAKEEYSTMLGKAIAYELSEADYCKLHTLVESIIVALAENKSFDEEYKTRLLNKFKRTQGKLNSRMYHFDGFWGMIVDVWVLLGKSHSAGKPLAKKAQQVADMIWDIQAETEGVKKKIPVTLLPESRKPVLAK